MDVVKQENLILENEKFIYHKDGLIDSPQIIEKLLNIKKSKEFTTNINNPWPDHLIPEGVGEVKIWDVLDITICSYLCCRIAELFPKVRTNNYIFDFQVTEWQDGAFIPWHRDSHHLCALTCYLEDNTKYGGEFLCKPFDDQTIGMFLEPKPNRTIFIKNIQHCVTKIHKGTRTTLQVWGNEK